jgi:hypothetical protein
MLLLTGKEKLFLQLFGYLILYFWTSDKWINRCEMRG